MKNQPNHKRDIILALLLGLVGPALVVSFQNFAPSPQLTSHASTVPWDRSMKFTMTEVDPNEGTIPKPVCFYEGREVSCQEMAKDAKSVTK